MAFDLSPHRETFVYLLAAGFLVLIIFAIIHSRREAKRIKEAEEQEKGKDKAKK